jgi:hypothetical protein
MTEIILTHTRRAESVLTDLPEKFIIEVQITDRDLQSVDGVESIESY